MAEPKVINKAATEGTRVHAVVDKFFAEYGQDVEATLEAVGKDRDRPVLEWLKAVHRGRLVYSEVKFAYKTDGTSRVLTSRKERDYSQAGPDEYPGTIDMMFLGHDDVVEVQDLKTGNPANLEPIYYSGQLTALAAMVATVLSVRKVRISYLLTNGGVRRSESATLNSEDFGLIQVAIDKAMANRAKASPRRNEMCWKCPAKKVCPLWAKK